MTAQISNAMSDSCDMNEDALWFRKKYIPTAFFFFSFMA